MLRDSLLAMRVQTWPRSASSRSAKQIASVIGLIAVRVYQRSEAAMPIGGGGGGGGMAGAAPAL